MKGDQLRLFSSQSFSHIHTPKFLKSSHSSYLPACEDETECSETSAYKIQSPGNYPEESVQHSEHGECLKSRIPNFWLHISQDAKGDTKGFDGVRLNLV